MQTLIYKSEDVERIVKAGLISTGMAMFTAADDVRINIYRGNGNVMALKVVIRKKKEYEENKTESSIQETSQGEPEVSKA